MSLKDKNTIKPSTLFLNLFVIWLRLLHDETQKDRQAAGGAKRQQQQEEWIQKNLQIDNAIPAPENLFEQEYLNNPEQKKTNDTISDPSIHLFLLIKLLQVFFQ